MLSRLLFPHVIPLTRTSLTRSCLGNIICYSSECPTLPPCKCSGSGGTGAASKLDIKYVQYVKPPYIQHDYKNMRLKRPMSPHLEIYGPTLPSMTSISERITGIILSFYVFMVSLATLMFSQGVDVYVSLIQSLGLGGFSLFILKIILGFPFSFHFFIGLRFIAWSFGKLISLKEVYSTAYQAIAAAGVLSVLLAML